MPSDPASVTIIGLIGVLLAALLTAVVQPIWTNYISPKSRLHVKITPHHFKIPKFLKDGIIEYRYNYRLNIQPTEELKEKLLDISYCKGHFSVSIRNKSRSKIDGLNVRLSDGEKFFADTDGDDPTFSGKIMNLGSLDPESTINLHLWTRSDASLSAWTDPCKTITVRASAYDKILMEAVAVDYVKSKYFIIPKKVTLRVLGVLWLLFMVTSITFSINTSKMDTNNSSGAHSNGEVEVR